MLDPISNNIPINPIPRRISTIDSTSQNFDADKKFQKSIDQAFVGMFEIKRRKISIAILPLNEPIMVKLKKAINDFFYGGGLVQDNIEKVAGYLQEIVDGYQAQKNNALKIKTNSESSLSTMVFKAKMLMNEYLDATNQDDKEKIENDFSKLAGRPISMIESPKDATGGQIAGELMGNDAIDASIGFLSDDFEMTKKNINSALGAKVISGSIDNAQINTDALWQIKNPDQIQGVPGSYYNKQIITLFTDNADIEQSA